MDCKSIQSSSSSQMICKHDVFVSFRGEDTRYNFTDHLLAALRRKGIDAFRDDTNLKKGESISPELLQAIEASRVLIVVFSKTYAASTWCLRELAKIVDCIQESGKHVLPVFYDVDPSEVRNQSEDYGKAFVVHEERFKQDLETVQRWKGALTQVANLCGWDVRDKPQYGEIEKIVEKVTSILDRRILSFADDLVGIHSPLEQVEKLLDLGSNEDVRVVGICGMGGIGKTTLATVLYDRISHQYDARCFIDDVSKIYRDSGPTGVQKQLLCQALNEENIQIYNHSEATNLVRTRLCHVKALIVLDNVDKDEQLEKLVLKREWVGAGSRIIIISRDKHILEEHGVDEVYEVQLLNYDNALQLFCRKAFKCDDIMRDYEEMTDDVLRYAEGLPLAMKVLGSFLFGRNVSDWRSALSRLRENPNKDIMDVLRISFDGLEEMEKEIFLDIACFFNNQVEEYVKKVLEYCGFESDIGIRVLIDKSLITLSDGLIGMHDLLEELGRKIVRENSPKEPGMWSRLWLRKDLHNVMLENTAIENLEAIVVQNQFILGEITSLRAEVLSRMSRLRLLILKYVKFSGSLNSLSNKLRYLEWGAYPFTSLPSSFKSNELVELILPHSSIKQLWEGIKPLQNLRRMDLRYSKNLIKTPDFSGIPNLEELNLEECTKLVWIDPSIGVLRKLACLNLSKCKSLIKMPDFSGTSNLEVLNLEECTELVWIDLSIGVLRKLASLNLKNCKNLVNVPNSILGLSSLEVVNLSGCSKLFNNQQLLEKPRHAKRLKMFDTSETAIQWQLTSSICKMLMLPFHFFYSRRHEDSMVLLLPSLPSFTCLRDLDLSFCNVIQIPDAIGWLHCLERLDLGGNNFVRLPCSIKELSKLINLNLEHCKQLKYLPELPSTTVLPLLSSQYNRGGLYIFNCPKLSEMERCCSMAFTWMIQLLQVNMESSLPLGKIDIVIPGTQIPGWFNHQSVGNPISIESSSAIMHDNNWIGVACCAAFVAHDDPSNLSNEMTPYIGCGFLNKKRGSGLYPLIPVLLGKDLVTVESDHLWLLYFTREEFMDRYISEITEGTHDLDGIEFATEIANPKGLHLEVKNCGFRWVFKHDLEELKRTMTRNGHNSIQIDDDLGIAGGPIISSEVGKSSVRKRKFFTLEDEP